MKHQEKPATPSGTEAYIQQLESQIKQKDRAYDELKEKYEILRRAFFGRSSEKLSAEESRQASLFNEAEEIADDEALQAKDAENSSSETTVKTPRRSPDCKRRALPASLPREEVYLDLSDDEKQCGCGKTKKKIGEEVSEELVIKPAEIFVRRFIRLKYACDCEGSADESQSAVVTAPAADKLIPKSIASSSLVAHILISKYCDALPLYRQEKQFKRLGINLSRGSMSRWVLQLGKRISPLLNAYDERIRSGPLIGMDETTVQVHREVGKDDNSTSYMWVARGGDPQNPLIHYMYHPSRKGSIPTAYLRGYSGALQVDGYAGYNQAVKEHDLIHIGCLAHVRRKFYECSQLSGGSKASLAVMGKISAIYAAEKKIQKKELSDEQIVERRIEIIIPLITKLQRLLEKKIMVVSKSSSFGKAVAYALGQLPKIKQYAAVPCATLDNNATEQAIRPFVIGRGNWLFSDTPSGAHASAAWYSLIESAKSAGLDPAAYITYVLDHLNETERSQQWDSLLPDRVRLY